jgi:uncharacterized membrane protein required for colicin V production
LAILALLILSVLSGFHRGFLVSILSIASFFISWLAAYLFMPLVAGAIMGQEDIVTQMLYYTEGAETLGSVDLSRALVSELDNVSAVVSGANLPYPINTLVHANISGEVFQSAGLTTVGEYFNHTIVNVAINVISFLAIFLLVTLILSFVIRGVDFVTKLPVLHQFDRLLGAGFGLIRGILIIFLVFMLVPLVLTVLSPFPDIQHYIEDSAFGNFFYNSNFLLGLIPGV